MYLFHTVRDVFCCSFTDFNTARHTVIYDIDVRGHNLVIVLIQFLRLIRNDLIKTFFVISLQVENFGTVIFAYFLNYAKVPNNRLCFLNLIHSDVFTRFEQGLSIRNFLIVTS